MFFSFSLAENTTFDSTYVLDDTSYRNSNPIQHFGTDAFFIFNAESPSTELHLIAIKLNISEVYNFTYNYSVLTLDLWINDAEIGDFHNLSFHKIFNNFTWDETSLIWNNRPLENSGYNSTSFYSMIIEGESASDVFYNFDITSLIDDCVSKNETECSFLIRPVYINTATGDNFYFRSKEHTTPAQRPSFTIYYDICSESWQPQYDSCLVNDTQLKFYTDSNACGTTVDLPFDNGTYVGCNYCSEDIDTIISGCIWNGSGSYTTTSYQDNNYFSCCTVTSIMADCSIEYSPYNTSLITPCELGMTDFEVNYDVEALYGIKSQDKVFWKYWINNSNMTEDYDCISYVKIYDNGTIGELIQVNPIYEKRVNRLFSLEATYDDREYFHSSNGLGNVYFTNENLVVDGRDYLFGIQCTGNNEKLNSEKIVQVGYETFGTPIVATVWGIGNVLGILLLIFGLVFIASIIGYFVVKLKGGFQ